MPCPTCGQPDRTITTRAALDAEPAGTVIVTANGATVRKSWLEVRSGDTISLPARVIVEAPRLECDTPEDVPA